VTEPDLLKELEDLDVRALLDRVERQGANGSAGVLSVEIDSLLGRPSKQRKADQSGSRPTKRDDQTRAHEWYFKLIATVPGVPSPSRAATTARAIEAGLFADERLRLGGFKTVEEEELLRAVAAVGEAEYEYLIQSNLRLVFHWARRQQHLVGEDLVQDAFQAGCLGLMRGIQGWDHQLGFTLSTYVSSHIRQAIQRWRHDTMTTIRLPVHVWEKLEADADHLSESVKNAAEAAQNIAPLDSLDAYAGEFAWDGGLDAFLDLQDRERLVSDMLDSLSEREAEVLRLRHGLDGGSDSRTLEEIGGVFGVTRERIRQIESKATKKLRTMFVSSDDADGSGDEEQEERDGLSTETAVTN
jgi:RNA polymerase sigma factor (sigma-70 family)